MKKHRKERKNTRTKRAATIGKEGDGVEATGKKSKELVGGKTSM